MSLRSLEHDAQWHRLVPKIYCLKVKNELSAWHLEITVLWQRDVQVHSVNVEWIGNIGAVASYRIDQRKHTAEAVVERFNTVGDPRDSRGG